MQVPFHLAFEFGYLNDDVEAELVAKTDQPYWYLIRLPQGYNSTQGVAIDACVREGYSIVDTTCFTASAAVLEALPLWTPEQAALWADMVF